MAPDANQGARPRARTSPQGERRFPSSTACSSLRPRPVRAVPPQAGVGTNIAGEYVKLLQAGSPWSTPHATVPVHTQIITKLMLVWSREPALPPRSGRPNPRPLAKSSSVVTPQWAHEETHKAQHGWASRPGHGAAEAGAQGSPLAVPRRTAPAGAQRSSWEVGRLRHRGARWRERRCLATPTHERRLKA